MDSEELEWLGRERSLLDRKSEQLRLERWLLLYEEKRLDHERDAEELLRLLLMPGYSLGVLIATMVDKMRRYLNREKKLLTR